MWKQVQGHQGENLPRSRPITKKTRLALRFHPFAHLSKRLPVTHMWQTPGSLEAWSTIATQVKITLSLKKVSELGIKRTFSLMWESMEPHSLGQCEGMDIQKPRPSSQALLEKEEKSVDRYGPPIIFNKSLMNMPKLHFPCLVWQIEVLVQENLTLVWFQTSPRGQKIKLGEIRLLW